MGQEISGVKFEIKDGTIVNFSAKSGQHLLKNILETPGARQFGEIAIGNNKNISTFTKSILFDEKIGGSIHMAIGSSYPETGGLNKSSIHLDLITDMKEGGHIYANDTLIYKNGRFLI
mgnify:CR=1 FL=1